jgi:hypothetical protein
MTEFSKFNLLPNPIVPGERGRPARSGRRLAGQQKGQRPTLRQLRGSVILPAIAGLALCAPLISFAQAPALAKGFDAYRIVTERNIFDPERQPMVAGAPPPRAVAQPPKAGDYVALTGVMFDNGKALAFFSGSRADFDKVIELNGEIAGAKVTRIAPDGIEVTRAGKKIVVAVGQTVPFDDSAPGAAPIDATVSGAPAAAVTGTGETPPAAPPLPGNLSDVMRRMMERRQHELQ